jgi:acid phosphatase
VIRISRRGFLTAAALLAPTGGSQAAAHDPTFLVIGDWGTGAIAQRKLAFQMAEVAKTSQTRFIISTGDNFYPGGVDSVEDTQWMSSFEWTYDAPALMVPWYVTLGNHDHKGNIAAQLSYTNLSSRWRLPARYYMHSELLTDGTTADFFHLDTTPIIKTCDRQQLVWLAGALANSNAAWKIVIGHHPLYAGGNHGDTPHLINLLRPLLEQFGVEVYLNGHDHHLEHVVIGGINYITSGAGSKPRSARALEGTRFIMKNRLGFVSGRLSPQAMHIAFIADNGACAYRTILRRHQSRTASTLQRLGAERALKKRSKRVRLASCG